MNKKKKRIFIYAIIVSVIVAGIVFMTIRNGQYELNFNTAQAQQDSLEINVTATGEIQPLYQVEVGTQVSGIVEKLYVDFNSEVKKGQLLAELDRSTLMEMINQSKANLSDAESNLTFAKQNYERIKQLYENKAATQASFEEASNAYVQAKNRVTTARSNLQTAQVNLSYTKIYSPISGIVLNKAVEEGQTVASSFNTPTLFTIANDLTQMQVEANVDEADIGQVKEGQSVTFTVDAFPKDIFTGRVRQVRLEPTVTSNVVTYTVIIDAPNPQEKLFPGMTANVSIVVKNEKGISIPTEAIHYKPDEETIQLVKKQNIEIIASDKRGEHRPQMRNPKQQMIWLKCGQTIRQQTVTTGLNDGAKTIINHGLQAGDEVVLSIEKIQKKNSKPQSAGSNPFMPGPPQRKKR